MSHRENAEDDRGKWLQFHADAAEFFPSEFAVYVDNTRDRANRSDARDGLSFRALLFLSFLFTFLLVCFLMLCGIVSLLTHFITLLFFHAPTS